MNRKHQQFVNEYLKSLNATRAYMKAYPAASYETARRNGSELLTNTDIAQEVKRRLDENAMTADEVLARLAEYGRAEYAPYIKKDGSVDIAKLIEDDKGHLIKSVKETEHGRVYEFYDAYTAVVQLGKYHKLFVERSEVSGPNGGPIVVKGYAKFSPDDWDDDDAG